MIISLRDNPYALNDVMQFDHVIEVHSDGTVTDGPERPYGPEAVFDDKIEGDTWELLTGYTEQYGYRGSGDA